MGRKIKNLEAYIMEALDNIRNDRAITSALLTDLFVEIKKNKNLETHRNLGLIASKYVETLQRSNEQLVKITALLNKKQNIASGLDEEDKEELLDMIQGVDESVK
jgi:NCAIR mutase (PurE)-related protein